jgi:sulfoxide reductase heme-binding subunit YedZ
MRRVFDGIHAFLKTRAFYPLVFVLAAAPAAKLSWLTYRAFTTDPGALGVNPTEYLLHETGQDALMLLLFALTVTPVRRLTGWNRVQIVRRMIGVWSFVYAVAHVTIYVTLDQLSDVRAILDDIVKRKFITVGMLAFVILLALAATSTNGMIRRLGRRWQRLHRLAYVAMGAGLVHFAWGQKSNISEPLQWAAYGVVLMALRLWFSWRKRHPVARVAVPVQQR